MRSSVSDSGLANGSNNGNSSYSSSRDNLSAAYWSRSGFGPSAASGTFGRRGSSGRTFTPYESPSSGSEPVLTHPGEVDANKLKRWANAVASHPESRLAQTVLQRVNMAAVLASSKVQHDDVPIYNTVCGIEGSPVPNQLNSGRCWLFALTDVCRVFTARYYNLGDFQISQSYLFYYDHVAKANWFLEQMIALADRPLDDRTIVYLMSSTEAQDGGQYQMAVNLVQKYGLVPQSVYPESFNSSNSDQLDRLLTSKLREMALELRDSVTRSGIAAARAKKEDMLEEIYGVLAICCGTPPRPDEQFEWSFEDKKGKVQTIIKTPLEWARDCLGGYDPADCVSLVNDPRNRFGKTYTVDRLGNVVGGTPVKYYNLEIDQIKQFAIKCLQANVPMWFGCDVDSASNTTLGIMDLELYHYDDAFGTQLGMDKADRMRTGDSTMTHAMMICGVHLDSDERPVRWKIENSWGPKACIKGFICMTDSWFSEYVFQVVVPRSQLPPDLCDQFDSLKPTVLPAWDPMGACAGGRSLRRVNDSASDSTGQNALMAAFAQASLNPNGRSASSGSAQTGISSGGYVDSAQAMAARSSGVSAKQAEDAMGAGTADGAAAPYGRGSAAAGVVGRNGMSSGGLGGGMSGMLMVGADDAGNARARCV